MFINILYPKILHHKFLDIMMWI